MILNIKLEGRYGVGRPEMRWSVDIETNIEALSIKKMVTKSSIQKKNV
jgi:hypothetical protein